MGQNGAPDTVLIGIVVTISSMLGLFAINKVVKYVKACFGPSCHALLELRTKLDAHPLDVETREELGVELLGIAQYDQAVHHFKVACLIDPELIEARVNVGVAFAHAGQYEEGLAEFKKAFEIATVVSKKVEKLQDEHAKFERIIQMRDIFYHMADAYEGLSRFDKAVEFFGESSILCSEAEHYDHEDENTLSHIEERMAVVKEKKEQQESIDNHRGIARGKNCQLSCGCSLSCMKFNRTPVSIHWSCVLLIVSSYFADNEDGWKIIIVSAGAFASVFFHELSHALCYNLFHEGVEKVIVTFTGGVTIPKTKLVGAFVEVATSVSGPLVNILLWATFKALAECIGASENHVLRALGMTNLWMAVLNLIPIFPLDGGRILRGLCRLFFPLATSTVFASVLSVIFGVLQVCVITLKSWSQESGDVQVSTPVKLLQLGFGVFVTFVIIAGAVANIMFVKYLVYDDTMCYEKVILQSKGLKMEEEYWKGGQQIFTKHHYLLQAGKFERNESAQEKFDTYKVPGFCGFEFTFANSRCLSLCCREKGGDGVETKDGRSSSDKGPRTSVIEVRENPLHVSPVNRRTTFATSVEKALSFIEGKDAKEKVKKSLKDVSENKSDSIFSIDEASPNSTTGEAPRNSTLGIDDSPNSRARKGWRTPKTRNLEEDIQKEISPRKSLRRGSLESQDLEQGAQTGRKLKKLQSMRLMNQVKTLKTHRQRRQTKLIYEFA